jgi:hypothetical protein
MQLYLPAQRPQMPACRHDCVHIAEASHVLGAWAKRGMASPVLRAWESASELQLHSRFRSGFHPRTWTWEWRMIRLRAQMTTGRHGLRDKGHTVLLLKPPDAQFRYLHINTQVQRPIKACQGTVQLPCNSAVIALCR